jgi:hypothetical protein
LLGMRVERIFVAGGGEQNSDAGASRERVSMFTSPRVRGEVVRAKRGG